MAKGSASILLAHSLPGRKLTRVKYMGLIHVELIAEALSGLILFALFLHFRWLRYASIHLILYAII